MLAIRAIVGQRFADRFPELIPYRQYSLEIGLDVTIFAAIRARAALPRPARQRAVAVSLDRRRAAHRTSSARCSPRSCRCSADARAGDVLYAGNTLFAETRRTTSRITGPTSHGSSRRASCSRSTERCRPGDRLVHEPPGVAPVPTRRDARTRRSSASLVRRRSRFRLAARLGPPHRDRRGTQHLRRTIPTRPRSRAAVVAWWGLMLGIMVDLTWWSRSATAGPRRDVDARVRRRLEVVRRHGRGREVSF